MKSLSSRLAPAALSLLLGAASLSSTALFAQTSAAPAAPQAEQDPAALPETTPAPAASSHAAATPGTVSAHEPGAGIRIVRLSQVKGDVQLDRLTGNGYELAFSNLPIVQGSRLRTGEGVAEVEFEDGTTFRLTPRTTVDFPELTRSPNGSTTSVMHVAAGMVYASSTGAKGNLLTLVCDSGKVFLPPSSHIRLSVGQPSSTLAVFNGSAQVERLAGAVTVPKKKSLVFSQTQSDAQPELAKNDSAPFDAWDKDALKFQSQYSNANAYAGASGLYSVSDLNYYGSFNNLAGCGAMWRPYLASAAWDPYANGTWALYPGAGYSWVSPYPWGWAPFHYGSWQSCGGVWGWRPGGAWRGLNNQPGTINTSALRHPATPTPPRGVVTARTSLVPVNTRPLPVSHADTQNSFVFRNDSAGIGVPRQTSGKLGPVSAMVQQHGVAYAPSQNGAFGARPGIQPGGAPNLHNAGSAPASRTASPNGPVAAPAPAMASPSAGAGRAPSGSGGGRSSR